MKKMRKCFYVMCILLMALGNIIAQSNNDKYGIRFLQHCKVYRGGGFQFRSTSATVNPQTFFGTSEFAIGQWIDDAEDFVEDELGFNVPGSLFNKFDGLAVGIPDYVGYDIKGWEIVNEFELMTPYIGGKLSWSGRGRMEKMSLFGQPANIWRLSDELLSDHPEDFVLSVTEFALLDEANEQKFVQGRANLELVIDVKNLIFFKLKKPVFWIGKSRCWIDPELTLSRVWTFDASHRLGIATLVDARSQLDEAVDGGFLEDESDIAVEYFAAKIDNLLFAPLGVPYYKGYKANIRLSLGTSWMKLFGGVSYESITNNTRGVSRLRSMEYRVGLEIGLQKYSKNPRRSQITPDDLEHPRHF